MRFRRTEICYTCAKLKNICQSCMFDLQYGLPVQIRDSVLNVRESVPKNEPNREYFLATNAARLARGDVSLLDYDRAAHDDPAAQAILQKLAPKERKYERNLAPPCSFYAKGKCTRGETCPYRHALVAERYPSLQSYRDRYYGENDPAAEKLLEHHPDVQLPDKTSKPRQDKSIKCLYLQGLRDGLDQDLIKEFFDDHAPVLAVDLLSDTTSALIHFSTKNDLETAATETLGNVEIRGVPVRVSWATPQILKSLSKGDNN